MLIWKDVYFSSVWKEVYNENKNCKIKKETIVYEVLTSGNQPFTYELPKDLSSHNARKYLEFISQKLDGDKLTKEDSLWFY